MIGLSDLKSICLNTKESRILQFLDPLNQAMAQYGIDQTPERECMFLAQICHESGCFRYVQELASGSFYEGRADLGNTEVGDGERFKGRGLIQITGRANYQKCGDALGYDLIAQPELLESPELATMSAAYWWSAHGLNELADKGDFLLITKRINGGTNGYPERQALLKRAQAVLV